jgi:hypothetical protein
MNDDEINAIIKAALRLNKNDIITEFYSFLDVIIHNLNNNTFDNFEKYLKSQKVMFKLLLNEIENEKEEKSANIYLNQVKNLLTVIKNIFIMIN